MKAGLHLRQATLPVLPPRLERQDLAAAPVLAALVAARMVAADLQRL